MTATEPPPPPPVAVVHNGHTTWLKWHRARRRATDPAFTSTRIIEGMRVGASVEVDLVIHAARGFAVLHDRDVARATTGRGDVGALDAAHLRDLRLRAQDGTPIAETVLLLEDLHELLAGIDIHPDAVLQLDFKEDAAALDPLAIDTFAEAVAPFARHTILSCGDADAVRLLTDPVPAIGIGYDPCHGGAVRRVLRSRAFDDFVGNAVDASPRAEMVYLEQRLVLEADRRGYDIVDAFHRHGRRVDAYTVQQADRKSIRDVRALLARRVDQITTDDPEGLLYALTHR
ncbi:glycerophosphodiester phosphodiesterase family protein [Gordonia sp. CPCC 206044]|uniref:glycerophosphodiester phosphodiesterase n=1 Tax=Gordonia sp. CPCC 206044 TaxID=3140793 RepID=UPI003AF34E16